MLLNKIPVLDKGYVALISSALSHSTYKDVLDEFFRTADHASLKDHASATLVFRAPIFVQLYISQAGFSCLGARDSTVEAYTPNSGEIACPDHDTSRLIADDIARTTDALLVNPAAYRADGADQFISQLIMPISTYATFLVTGTLRQWMEFYQNKNVPAPIKAYKTSVEQIIKAEWKNV